MSQRPDLSQTTQRFAAGQRFRFGKFEVRIERGRKSPDDLRIDVRCTDWHAIGFEELGLLADALYENEHRLYRPSLGYEGGEKLLSYIRSAVRHGYEKAATELRLEKTAASARRTLFDTQDGAA
jgi:hypothetical protein